MKHIATCLLAGGLALAAGLGMDLRTTSTPTGPAVVLTTGQAEAAPRHVKRRAVRRTVRRTTRRVNRRYDYLRSLPRSCVWRRPYHYCNGIYYRPGVVDGVNVYIVVTP